MNEFFFYSSHFALPFNKVGCSSGKQKLLQANFCISSHFALPLPAIDYKKIEKNEKNLLTILNGAGGGF